MSAYLKRFEAMVKEIEAEDAFELVEFTPRPPVSKSELSKLEKGLGGSLAPAVRDFYSETDGLKLHWQVKPNVSPEVAEKLRAKSKDYYVEIAEYVGAPFAIVNILPLKHSLLRPNLEELGPIAEEETIEFNGNAYTGEEFAHRLKPFDILRDEFSMAFVLEEGSGDPPVVLLTERWTEWAESRLTDFGSYLEMVIATRGIAEARVKIFSTSRAGAKPIKGDAEYWTSKHTPDLFA